MTYLEIVNAVLKRLRESDVAAIEQTAYSRVVSAFVNDAKRLVEGAWDWSALRTDVQLATVDGTSTYSLTGYGADPEVLGVWNNTQNLKMRQMAPVWYKQQVYTQDTLLDGAPSKYFLSGVDGSGDAEITVYPEPDAVYDVRVWLSYYQAELTLGTDVLLVPSWPVILQAVAMLAEEKGETGGATSARYFEMADKALDDAIAYDAAKGGREIDWRMS